jgi:hypothetical protein
MITVSFMRYATETHRDHEVGYLRAYRPPKK